MAKLMINSASFVKHPIVAPSTLDHYKLLKLCAALGEKFQREDYTTTLMDGLGLTVPRRGARRGEEVAAGRLPNPQWSSWLPRPLKSFMNTTNIIKLSLFNYNLKDELHKQRTPPFTKQANANPGNPLTFGLGRARQRRVTGRMAQQQGHD